MFKSIIKEIIILLLLIIAILLILGVFFYDKIPTTKIIPTKVTYTTPENVQEELKEQIIENNEEIIVTYQIEDVDLRLYQSQGSYNKGKINPFEDYTPPVTNTETDSTTTQPLTNTTTNTGNTTNTNGIGNFFDKPTNK